MITGQALVTTRPWPSPLFPERAAAERGFQLRRLPILAPAFQV